MSSPAEFLQHTNHLAALGDCALCPRRCHANRFAGKTGFCRTGAGFNVGSVCVHRGEEPVISGQNGICNIFFTNCNLQCIYCQNHQISGNSDSRGETEIPLESLINQITGHLDRGITHVGFVSPSHVVPQVLTIIQRIESLGYKPVWVYNTNGYDLPETIRSLDGIIDVYLPDLKYLDEEMSGRFSGAKNYPEFAKKSLREMYRQKGSALHLNDDEMAVSGIIIRHLVLPGFVENSLRVVRFIAEELSPRIHVSLMSQYYPTTNVKEHRQLGRGINNSEYQVVVDEMERLGIYRGWIQEFASSDFYRPDFNLDHPFESSYENK